MINATLIPGVRRVGSRYRPVVRVMADGCMRGSKASPHTFATPAFALAWAREAAAVASINPNPAEPRAVKVWVREVFA